jgi:parvulin-like peptidyl-prolyl isomerase
MIRVTGTRRLTLGACVAALGATALSAPMSASSDSEPPSPIRLAQAPAAKSTGQSAAAPRVAHDVIARVGDIEVTADDLRAYIAGFSAQEQAVFAKDPALLAQAVRQLLTNRLVLEELVAKKWDQQPNVTAQLERIREKAVVELYLQAASTPATTYPSEEELQKTFDANRSALVAPREFQLRQIFVAAPKNADKAADAKAKERLDEIQRRLKTPGADFVAVASSGNDASNGGDLGWLAEGQIRPEISAQVMGLAKNAVSEPIRLDDGWHIIKLVDTKPAHALTLPEVRDQLVQQMRAERAASLRRAFLAQLLKQRPPVINEIALSTLFDTSRK